MEGGVVIANDFGELANRTKAHWSSDTRRMYDASSADFASEMDERARLGAALADARKAKSLTQQELSALTGIQQAEISRIERGPGNPTAATLMRLADALEQKLMLVPAGS